MRVAAVLTGGAVVLLAACGSSGTDDTAEPARSSVAAAADADSPESAEPTTGAAVDDQADSETDQSAATVPAASPVDPSQLDPGTAVVVVDGRELRFARGDSTFDVCDLAPDFGLGDVEMDLVDGPEEGGPHFDLHYGPDKQVLVVAFLPDTGFVAGKGEETDPYVQNFDIVPPVMDPIEVGDGFAAGTTTMVNVFTGDEVQASFAVRCA